MITLVVSLTRQELSAFKYGVLMDTYPISSAKKGAGSEKGSYQTPLGLHVIRAKIGENEPLNRVFVGRRPTDEIYHSVLAEEYPNRDWILTRILWLSGCERGKNRLKKADGTIVDSMQRYIYLHGTPDTEPMGRPESHGCIRMRNRDIITLFEQVSVGTYVNIIM